MENWRIRATRRHFWVFCYRESSQIRGKKIEKPYKRNQQDYNPNYVSSFHVHERLFYPFFDAFMLQMVVLENKLFKIPFMLKRGLPDNHCGRTRTRAYPRTSHDAWNCYCRWEKQVWQSETYIHVESFRKKNRKELQRVFSTDEEEVIERTESNHERLSYQSINPLTERSQCHSMVVPSFSQLIT